MEKLIYSLTSLREVITPTYYWGLVNYEFGTKLDLAQKEDKQYKVDRIIVEQFLKNHDEKDYVETSSKDNVNIQNVFIDIVKKILDSHGFVYEKIG